jgi:hypothetical protein
MSKAEPLGNAETAAKGVRDMTTHQSVIATFTMSLSEIFANISRTAIQNFEAKRQKARLARDIEILSAFDPHMLDDIGMKNFNRLPMAQQENLLLKTIRRAA